MACSAHTLPEDASEESLVGALKAVQMQLATMNDRIKSVENTMLKLWQVPLDTRTDGIRMDVGDASAGSKNSTGCMQSSARGIDTERPFDSRATKQGSSNRETPQAKPKISVTLREEHEKAVHLLDLDYARKPPYNVCDFYHSTGLAQAIVKHKLWHRVTMGVIVASAIYAGVELEYNNADSLYDSDWAFVVVSNCFTVFFTAELVLRFLAFRVKRDCFGDAWFVFDAILVFFMLAEWLLDFIIEVGGTAKRHPMHLPTHSLRLLHVTKIVRMANFARNLPELVMMIQALLRCMRSFASTLCLLMFLLYTASLVIRRCVRDEDDLNSDLRSVVNLDFSTLSNCMWTLVTDGTLMLDGSYIFTELLSSRKPHIVLAGATFFLYTLVTALCILQMLVGVLCQVVTEVQEDQRDSIAYSLMRNELAKGLQRKIGVDTMVTCSEFMTIIREPDTMALLRELKINRLFLLELQRSMFNDSEQQVPIAAVLELLLACRGDSQSSIASLATSVGFVFNEFERLQRYISDEFNAIRSASAPDNEANSTDSI